MTCGVSPTLWRVWALGCRGWRVDASASSCHPSSTSAPPSLRARGDCLPCRGLGTASLGKSPRQRQAAVAAVDRGHAAGRLTEKKTLPQHPICVVPPELPGDPNVWQNAMVLIDKPREWTSFDLCGKLRSALKIKKVGHAGTLDPMATGLVIVCVGKGTKHVDNFMAQEKEYTGTIRLGEATASYDAESEVTERRPWEHITDDELLAARDGLVGDIMQVPPMYSAIKIKGEKLYELARKGLEVERPPRPVSVSTFELRRNPDDPQSLNFRVVCSKGTYIRSLAHDLGISAGTVAHLTSLRRERIGDYSVADAWDILELADGWRERKEMAAAELTTRPNSLSRSQ